LNHEKKLKADEENRKLQRKNKQKKLSIYLKKLTSSIIVRLVEGIFQSFISVGACVVYVVNTYYEDGNEFILSDVL